MSCGAKVNVLGILTYDGTDFLGWQKTKMGPSIEEELQKSLEMLLQEPAVLQAASRTDAGVHARGQVFQFFSTKDALDLPLLLYRLNQVLPKSISVKKLEIASPSFHPTVDSKTKEYRYQISNCNFLFPIARTYWWHVPQRLNFEAIEMALPYFLGKKDFSWLCNQKPSETYAHHDCTLETLFLEEKEGLIHITMRGDRFLYKMARNLVGTLVYIGRGRIEGAAVPSLFEKKDRKSAGPTAPACGLFLESVSY